MCACACKIKEFGSHGEPLRELTLPDDIANPLHVIQTGSGQFIVCHGDHGDQQHRVCMVTADGRHIVHSHGGCWGSDTEQYYVPNHLAVDDNEFVFVADINNRRVTLLSPTLEYVRQLVSPDQLNWMPVRLCLDTERRRLYVAVNKLMLGVWTAGRVVVFNV